MFPLAKKKWICFASPIRRAATLYSKQLTTTYRKRLGEKWPIWRTNRLQIMTRAGGDWGCTALWLPGDITSTGPEKLLVRLATRGREVPRRPTTLLHFRVMWRMWHTEPSTPSVGLITPIIWMCGYYLYCC